MPLWDKVKEELDRAGRVAQEALDEGRIRVELLRARQLADKSAQRLGYAVARARAGGGEAEVDRLHAALAEHEAEADRLQAQLDLITRRTHADDTTPGATASAAASGAASGTGDAGTSAASTVDATDTIDFGGNSGASHRPDGSVDVGGAGTGGGGTEHGGGASSTFDAPGAPPGERNEWNREHL
jgi:uncharacterized coiled-coil protein SlyX